MAPCSIFFDATKTVGLANGDYVDAYFAWNFGDPQSGLWSTNSQNKNIATGFIAAHVFETPGKYTVISLLNNLAVSDSGLIGGDFNYPLSNLNSDYNLWYSPSSSLFAFGMGLSAWTGRGFDLHSLNANPKLSDPLNMDLRLLAGSPAIDAGTSSLALFDYASSPRPIDGNGDGTAAWDMGAHEFSAARIAPFAASSISFS